MLTTVGERVGVMDGVHVTVGEGVWVDVAVGVMDEVLTTCKLRTRVEVAVEAAVKVEMAV